ncbi:MAG: hypothetical protein KC620_25885, partial [Myxococcales bacterium]|nr:hypothetical protein [Myxococcales bacterium]
MSAASPPAGRLAPRLVVPLVIAFFLVIAATISWSGRPSEPTSGGHLVFSDDFSGPAIGDDYFASPEADLGWEAGTWTIVDGRLRAEKIHNAALWLKKPLPEKVRIEFDARAESPEGDVKCEVFGDGRTHQSGYILIFGGWKNTINAIARQDEHGEDRKEDTRCAARKGRRLCVEPEVDYHWTIERTDGELRWYLDGNLFLTYDDRQPVRGRHFAFNDWEAPVTFDNLRIYDLG